MVSEAMVVGTEHDGASDGVVNVPDTIGVGAEYEVRKRDGRRTCSRCATSDMVWRYEQMYIYI